MNSNRTRRGYQRWREGSEKRKTANKPSPPLPYILVVGVPARPITICCETGGAPRLLNTDPYGAGWLCRVETDRWERERAALLHGDAAVTAWIRGELAAYEERR